MQDDLEVLQIGKTRAQQATKTNSMESKKRETRRYESLLQFTMLRNKIESILYYDVFMINSIIFLCSDNKKNNQMNKTSAKALFEIK